MVRRRQVRCRWCHVGRCSWSHEDSGELHNHCSLSRNPRASVRAAARGLQSRNVDGFGMLVHIYAPPSYSAPLNRAYLSLSLVRVKDRVRAVPRAVGSQATCHAMEVTQEDLQRQCAGQYDAYIKCVSEGGAENCLTQQHELEQCATATVQLVRAINSSCGKQYAQFQACFKRAGERQIANPDCDRPSAAFWECAQVQIDRAGEQVM